MKRVKNIGRVEPPHPFEAYAHVATPLSKEDGGRLPDYFPRSSGLHVRRRNAGGSRGKRRDAFAVWVSAQIDMGRKVPPPQWQPETAADASGKFVQRVPKTVHARLVRRAKAEGVSLNSLVLTFIAEGLGKREEKSPKTGHRQAG